MMPFSVRVFSRTSVAARGPRTTNSLNFGAEYASAVTGRTSLVVSYELTDFGVAVDIPDLG